jgi:nucleotide-binding universal stress UspA family protein
MSDIKTLLVHVDAGQRSAARLRAGRQLASRLQASLHALYAVNPAVLGVPIELAAAGATASIAEEIDEGRLATARKVLQQVASEPGVPIAWHEASGLALDAVAQQARCADLLLLGQHEPGSGDGGVPGDFAASLLMASGRPALVLPYVDTVKTIGGTVLVAWKDAPEAARAVAAALPLLQQAKRVHVASWGEEDGALATPGLDIEGYLHAHGVQAQRHRYAAAAGGDVGELIQSLAADLSADLLVMGCYGHSRARELVMGGASRTLLRSMSLPVLMSH